MNLKELYIKLFRKHQAVIIKFITETGRVTTHWALPSADNVSVKIPDIEDAIVLHKDATLRTTKRNIPTYFVYYKDCQPIKMDDLKRKGLYTTDELRFILDNDITQKAIKAGEKGGIGNEAKIIILVIIIGFIALGYFMTSELKKLAPIPEPEVVELIESE